MEEVLEFLFGIATILSFIGGPIFIFLIAVDVIKRLSRDRNDPPLQDFMGLSAGKWILIVVGIVSVEIIFILLTTP